MQRGCKAEAAGQELATPRARVGVHLALGLGLESGLRLGLGLGVGVAFTSRTVWYMGEGRPGLFLSWLYQ